MGRLEPDFADETALVTGASSGIGRAVALAFAYAGAAVVNADARETPRGEEAETPTHEAIRAAGGTAAFVETDVRDESDVAVAVEAAREFGGADVLVNSAGVHRGGTVRDLSPAALDRTYAVNVKGTALACRAAAEDVVERGESGAIVNLASISSTMAKTGQLPYEASKAAVQMLTRSAALDLADDGIRVNAVAPGRTATAFGTSSAAAKARSVEDGDLPKEIPLGRAARPEDCAEAVLFLASENAAYVTGETLFVDGGYQVI
jgi:NAD(P)-dependent dehydrogenase (short-subunit alcohol dehydrogenase family)